MQTNENHIINQSITNQSRQRRTRHRGPLSAHCCLLCRHASAPRLPPRRTHKRRTIPAPHAHAARVSRRAAIVESSSPLSIPSPSRLSLSQEYRGANQPITSRAPRTRTRSDGGVAVEVRQVGGVDLLVRHARILDNRDDAQRRQLLLGESTHLGARLIDHARQ